MQAEARRCFALLKVLPTVEQWEMLLSSEASTSVIAGAGSGKSTTLIHRLLIFHKLLGIPLDEMHVFSFTKASVRDFQQKRVTQLLNWEKLVEGKTETPQRREELTKAATRVVSTFHSALYQLRAATHPGAIGTPFDMLGNKAATEEDQGNFNPFLAAKLSAAQREIVNAAHTRAYH
jgi:superfamily I DNA/RNA helicase